IYRGDAFPKEFLDNAFIGECAGNLASRKLLFPDDVGLKAQRAPDEQHVEFLASTDIWFRPVQFANGPDGAFYVIDMHREIIEHPWSIPENMKKLLDLNSGNNCGRIFRVVPDGFHRPKPVRLDLASTSELAATLEIPNGWHRDTASRLLYERQDKSAVPLLVKLLRTSRSPLARIHAMYALEGLGALNEADVLRGMNDQEPWVRVHAIKLSERFSKHPSSKIFKTLAQLSADPSNLVRYQLAFTLGEFKGDITKPLATIARRDAASPWIQAAVLSSLANGAGEVFAELSRDAEFAASKDGQEFLRQLVSLVGARNNGFEVRNVLAFITKVNEPALSFSLTDALGEGLKRANTTLEAADQGGDLKNIFAQAQSFATDPKAPESARVGGIQLLASSDYKNSAATIVPLLKSSQDEPIQLAAISTLAHFPETAIASDLAANWANFSPRAKSEAIAVLLSRPERATILLKEIQSGAIPATDLTTPQERFLRTHHDANVRKLALAVLGSAKTDSRQAVVDAFQPALGLRGNAEEGRKIFQQRCTPCHHLGGLGFSVGPDLLSVKSNGKDKILVSILDPSREVAPQYMAFDIETKDGESYVGIIANESAASVTVRQAYGKEDIIQRSNIKSMRSQRQSLMPEGLEAGLSAQELANLLEFITTATANK
ncbi:MAG TPA: hypothetical protein VFB72_06280, partial [Verrucomicrobiae bacterium]|nr:hypothetical protein [Verrucomicrobiae bacterium]